MLFVAVEKIAAFISWGIQKMMLLWRGTGGQTMAEYIEREALLASLCQGNYPWTDFNDAIEIVENQQAADVSAVVHGQWIDLGDHMSALEKTLDIKMCSECHMCVVLEDFDNYCPHCGARMDVKKEG